MKYSFKTHPFEEKKKLLDIAVRWFESLNVQYSSSRIGQYKRDIDFMIKKIAGDKISELTTTDKFPQIINSLYETDEIILIYKGLSKLQITNDIKNNLSTIAKGPADILNESLSSSSHKARDISFELIMVALFTEAGYQVIFEADADLVLDEKKYIIFFECKRPNSFNSLAANIKKASKQLRNRYMSSKSLKPKYGIIAVSLEKILNPNHYMLTAKDDIEIDAIISQEVENFIRTNQLIWKNIKEGNTIGIIFFFKTIAIYQSRNIVTTCRFLAVNNIVDPDTIEIEILKEIISRLQKVLTN